MADRTRRRSLRGGFAVVAIAAGVVVTAIAGSGVPARAADRVVLRVGTTEALDSTNPWNTYLAVGYEAFQLTYDLLTEFDGNARPAPGFAAGWDRAPDRVTFHMRPDLKWSDGRPATSQDVCYSWGLALAAIRNKTHIGAGYLDPNVRDAGVTRIECPDDRTFVAYTRDPSDRIFQVYVPILPRHLLARRDYKAIATETFDPPLVGTGPYTLAEWRRAEFARFARNPNYWGRQGFADEVVIRFFATPDALVRALQANELDYARGLTPQQFREVTGDPTYKGSAGKANRWTELAFNTYGTGTGRRIPGGGPSTRALLDVAFRDALGYAIDKKTLVDRVLGGFGDVGTTNIPPALDDWHVEPAHPRTFDIELAKRKLDAAGYRLDAGGKRLDKEKEPIVLRLYTPESYDTYARASQLIAQWYGRLGIDVEPHVVESRTLGQVVRPPEAGGTANYDVVLWGWSGSADPNALLQIFRCDAIGGTSDSQYCNPAYDKLYNQQLRETGIRRRATLIRMQNLIHDEAPYDILYYDWNLDAYRTDRFAGWANMPPDGTPLFTYGVLNYTLLRDAMAEPSPGSGEGSGAATAAPSGAAPSGAAPSGAAPSGAAASGDASSAASPSAAGSTSPGYRRGDARTPPNPILIVVVIALAVFPIGAAVLLTRRAAADASDQ